MMGDTIHRDFKVHRARGLCFLQRYWEDLGVLHGLTLFMRRFETPRPTLRTINFLLFDHIGGLNTLLHTLFNKGTVVAPKTA